LDTVTDTEAVASTVPLALYPVAEIVCAPFAIVVEFQLNVPGGVEAK
jgi:hypothetical protein